MNYISDLKYETYEWNQPEARGKREGVQLPLSILHGGDLPSNFQKQSFDTYCISISKRKGRAYDRLDTASLWSPCDLIHPHCDLLVTLVISLKLISLKLIILVASSRTSLSERYFSPWLLTSNPFSRLMFVWSFHKFIMPQKYQDKETCLYSKATISCSVCIRVKQNGDNKGCQVICCQPHYCSKDIAGSILNESHGTGRFTPG